MFQVRAAPIDQHNAAVTPVGCAFDKSTDRFKYFRHRVGAREQFEQRLFTREQNFSLLAVVHIGLKDIPAEDTTCRVAHWQAANTEPAVNPVRSTETVLTVEGVSGFNRSLPGGHCAGKVIGVNGVTENPAI
jgi:hypothetical protein